MSRNSAKIALFVSIILMSLATLTHAQKRIAITIDDVPNTGKYVKESFEPVLLNRIDSLKVPVTIFVNEKKVYENEYLSENFDLLKQWVFSPNVQVANHSFSHFRCSETDEILFCDDIRKGGHLIGELTQKVNKKVSYFRFPYNDLGRDEKQQQAIGQCLAAQNLLTAPFTVESSDWMFDFLYRHYISEGQNGEAAKVAEAYLVLTRNSLRFFDSLAYTVYGRQIPHIYLCHDNLLNTLFLNDLLKIFSEEGFSVVPMDEVMTDAVYRQPIYYHGKWGFSWLYRWMSNESERKAAMKLEPDTQYYYRQYQRLRESK